jgi:NAD(P)-dependent dehydrogenase (short-subunit alcohol dehydrogenase family)
MVAIVTGGTGALGGAVTALFLSRGASVAGPYRSPEALTGSNPRRRT